MEREQPDGQPPASHLPERDEESARDREVGRIPTPDELRAVRANNARQIGKEGVAQARAEHAAHTPLEPRSQNPDHLSYKQLKDEREAQEREQGETDFRVTTNELVDSGELPEEYRIPDPPEDSTDN